MVVGICIYALALFSPIKVEGIVTLSPPGIMTTWGIFGRPRAKIRRLRNVPVIGIHVGGFHERTVYRLRQEIRGVYRLVNGMGNKFLITPGLEDMYSEIEVLKAYRIMRRGKPRNVTLVSNGLYHKGRFKRYELHGSSGKSFVMSNDGYTLTNCEGFKGKYLFYWEEESQGIYNGIKINPRVISLSKLIEGFRSCEQSISYPRG